MNIRSITLRENKKQKKQKTKKQGPKNHAKNNQTFTFNFSAGLFLFFVLLLIGIPYLFRWEVTVRRECNT